MFISYISLTYIPALGYWQHNSKDNTHQTVIMMLSLTPLSYLLGVGQSSFFRYQFILLSTALNICEAVTYILYLTSFMTLVGFRSSEVMKILSFKALKVKSYFWLISCHNHSSICKEVSASFPCSVAATARTLSSRSKVSL